MELLGVVAGDDEGRSAQEGVSLARVDAAIDIGVLGQIESVVSVADTDELQGIPTVVHHHHLGVDGLTILGSLGLCDGYHTGIIFGAGASHIEVVDGTALAERRSGAGAHRRSVDDTELEVLVEVVGDTHRGGTDVVEAIAFTGGRGTGENLIVHIVPRIIEGGAGVVRQAYPLAFIVVVLDIHRATTG